MHLYFKLFLTLDHTVEITFELESRNFRDERSPDVRFTISAK